ncbi:MAG: hypothetical protein EXR49_02035 [Dehalococcoidia bacterium]|nr:hypothetical protein [Dehalococcoidia bacterium]
MTKPLARISGASLMEIRRKMPEPMFNAYRDLTHAMWHEGTLDDPLRELLRLKSAELAHCVH